MKITDALSADRTIKSQSLLEAWDRCETDFRDETLKAQACVLGLQAPATKNGLWALVAYFPRVHHVLSRFWLSEEAGVDVKEQYMPLIREGYVVHIEQALIARDILRHIKSYLGFVEVKSLILGKDCNEHLRGMLEREGLAVEQLGPLFPGTDATMETFIEHLLRKGFPHHRHPVMRQMLSDLVLRKDSFGRMQPDMQRTGGDSAGVLALLMAMQQSRVLEKRLEVPPVSESETQKVPTEMQPAHEEILSQPLLFLTQVSIEPGAVVVAHYSEWLPSLEREKITSDLRRAFPGHQILILENGATLGIVNPAQQPEKTSMSRKDVLMATYGYVSPQDAHIFEDDPQRTPQYVPTPEPRISRKGCI